MAKAVQVRCARCNALWPVTSPRVRRRLETQQWVCTSAGACADRRTEILARLQRGLDQAWALLDFLAAGPDELVQAPGKVQL